MQVSETVCALILHELLVSLLVCNSWVFVSTLLLI